MLGFTPVSTDQFILMPSWCWNAWVYSSIYWPVHIDAIMVLECLGLLQCILTSTYWCHHGAGMLGSTRVYTGQYILMPSWCWNAWVYSSIYCPVHIDAIMVLECLGLLQYILTSTYWCHHGAGMLGSTPVYTALYILMPSWCWNAWVYSSIY